MHILLVEDEAPKARHVVAFLEATVPGLELENARSVRSALNCLQERVPVLAILDMSLPTFDIEVDESGGRPQGFGGLELLRSMALLDIVCPVVVLTGYESFSKSGGQVSLDSLSADLAREHPDLFKGIFHFSSAYGKWQDNLARLMREQGIIS